MAERGALKTILAVAAGGVAAFATAMLPGRRERLAAADGADAVYEREPPVEKGSGNVSVRPILAIAGAWLAFVCVALAILAVLYYKIGQPAPLPSVAGFPHPQLVTHPNSEYEKLVGPQKRALTSYGWVDRKAGIAHIAIARAIDEDLKRPDPYAPIGGGGS